MIKSAPILLFCFLFLTIHFGKAQNFELDQRKFARVRTAFAKKEAFVKTLFNKAQVPYPPKQIFIRIFKYERQIELWAMEVQTDTFKFIKRYAFCASSGNLGPKRQQGDYQIPEGFYYIDRFNPVSNFYLSLGINYPNAADRILGEKGKLGGDIFIHGNCVTIGCIPITDDKIMELYLIAVKAKSGGQNRIPVHIFPYNFSDAEKDDYFGHLVQYESQRDFWRKLKQGFLFFEKAHRIPKIGVNKKSGQYFLEQ